jgi:ubiquinone/menaquinone biosynthesis C-methylase UbiE
MMNSVMAKMSKTLAILPLLAIGSELCAAKKAAIATLAVSEQTYTQKTPTRGGTGKMYMDREISQVMGHLGAGWLERSEREREERTDLLVKNLDLKPNEIVADIGAGSGYFTFRMAKLVPEGKAFAVDISKQMLTIVKGRIGKFKTENVIPVLSTITDVKLPENSVDCVLIVDAYHEFSHPREMALSILKALKPGGRLVLIEYRLEDPKVPIKRLHKMTQAQSQKEMKAIGFEWKETRDMLPQQHFMVYLKPDAKAKNTPK